MKAGARLSSGNFIASNVSSLSPGTYTLFRAGQVSPSDRGIWFAGGDSKEGNTHASMYSSIHEGAPVNTYNVIINNPLIANGIFDALAKLERTSVDKILQRRDTWMDNYLKSGRGQSDGIAWIRMADKKLMGKLRSAGYDAVIYPKTLYNAGIEIGIPKWNMSAIQKTS